MILEIAGAAVLLAALVVLVRIDVGLGRLGETTGRIAKALEQGAAPGGTPGAGAGGGAARGSGLPTGRADGSAGAQAGAGHAAGIGAATGQGAYPSGAEVAAAIAAAKLVARPLAWAAPGMPAAASADGMAADRAEPSRLHHNLPVAYDGRGAGFIDVVGNDETQLAPEEPAAAVQAAQSPGSGHGIPGGRK